MTFKVFYKKKEVFLLIKKAKKHYLLLKQKKISFFLIDIFNGNLFLVKRKDQFRLWVEAYNKKYNFDIKVIESTFFPSLDNG